MTLCGKPVPSSQHLPTLQVNLTPQAEGSQRQHDIPGTPRTDGSPSCTPGGRAPRPHGVEMLHCVQHDLGGKAAHSSRHTLPPRSHPDALRRKDLNASMTGPARPVQADRPLARPSAEHSDRRAPRCFTAFSMTWGGKASHSSTHTLTPRSHPDAARRKDLNASMTYPARPVQVDRPLARPAAEHPNRRALRESMAFSMTYA